jgi:hypothetical protein
VPWLSVRRDRWFVDVLAAQIEHYQPDVLLNLDMYGIEPDLLRRMKRHVGLLVGQHAATRLPANKDYGCYDLVVSSFPPTLQWLRARGVRAELLRLAFEPDVLSSLQFEPGAFDLTFVGSFRGVHGSRIEWLERLCRSFPRLKIWAPGMDHVPMGSPLRGCYMGRAWGRKMLEVLAGSRITLNHHGDIPPYANNRRLYEATGAGALLVTDWKKNLHQMFEPGEEVVAYRSNEECVELVGHYLSHEDERAAIAAAGQRRCLRDHTYRQRTEELLQIVQAHA